MAGSMWIGEDCIGEIAAVTTSRTKRGSVGDDDPGCAEVGIAGTLVFSKLDYQLYEKHFPKDVEDPFKIDHVVVKLNPVYPGSPTTVYLMGFCVWNEGWDWVTHDVTNEYAITYTADVLDYGFDTTDCDVVEVIN